MAWIWIPSRKKALASREEEGRGETLARAGKTSLLRQDIMNL